MHKKDKDIYCHHIYSEHPCYIKASILHGMLLQNVSFVGYEHDPCEGQLKPPSATKMRNEVKPIALTFTFLNGIN